MRKYIFEFKEDKKAKQKTINAEDMSSGLIELLNKLTGEEIEVTNIICKGEITNDKKKTKTKTK